MIYSWSRVYLNDIFMEQGVSKRYIHGDIFRSRVYLNDIFMEQGVSKRYIHGAECI